jgi:DNA-binding MarR family transcriptional regulator
VASTTPPTAAPDQLSGLEAAWEQFFGSIRRARGRAASQPPGDDGLTLSQYQLLAPLLDDEEMPVGALALLAGVAPPTATRALDALVRRGLVDRRPSDTDRRCVIVRLTGDGEQAVRRRRAAVRRKRAALLRNLDPAEREQAERLLRRLAEMLDSL